MFSRIFPTPPRLQPSARPAELGLSNRLKLPQGGTRLNTCFIAPAQQRLFGGQPTVSTSGQAPSPILLEEKSWHTSNTNHASMRATPVLRHATTALFPACRSRTSMRWPAASPWILTAQAFAAWRQAIWRAAATWQAPYASCAPKSAMRAETNVRSTRWDIARSARKPAVVVPTNAVACRAECAAPRQEWVPAQLRIDMPPVRM